jgi:hypothetical protein
MNASLSSEYSSSIEDLKAPDLLFSLMSRQAIPTYTMSSFDLMETFCDEIRSMIGCYWWSKTKDKDKIYWLS